MIQSSSPWFAVNLSLLFPGLGQIHHGQVVRGLLWLLGMLVLLGAIFWAYLAPSGNVQVGAGALGMGVMLWSINLVDAHACVSGRQGLRFESFSLSSQQNLQLEKGKSLDTDAHIAGSSQISFPDAGRSQSRDLWFAVFLSQLLPGSGQLLSGQLLVGMFLVLLSVFCVTGRVGSLGLVLGLPALCALACVGLGGTHRNQDWQRKTLELALVIFVGRALFFGVFPGIRQVVEPFSVPSDSMFPTLRVGDRILVHKSHQYQPKPGEIIVFRDPTQTQESGEPRFFVKRIVGGPGDEIQITPGQIQRNRKSLIEPYVSELPRYQWKSGDIPARHFAVLGDNRNKSFDSSQWGLLPQSNIVGRAYRISWPPDRNRPLP